MRVKCVICDVVESIDNNLPLAKKLRNRPIHTYMCQTCHERIEERTMERKKTGLFTENKPQEETDEYI
ncbi:YlaI family protein [Salipaludibacillus daqingensis]|uniref:YlaI family protein n=1 Tax=Salipaludibacillus daqingensis TaxID=3041001 RepID=UPI0024748001|nr:YlaI family protein [Salipaludibacillus daqingensis]